MKDLFTGTLDLTNWEKYSVRENVAYEGVAILGLTQEVYRREVEGSWISVGVFTFLNRPAYIAWGPQSAVQCSMHATLSDMSVILDVREGCPEVVPILKAGEVVGFTLDAKEEWKR